MAKAGKGPALENNLKYKCPICGSIHAHTHLCPVVGERLAKIRNDQQSFLMGAIVLECIKKKVNFCDVLSEIAYYMAFMHTLKRRQPEGDYFNGDFVVSYFASALGCSASKFLVKREKLVEEYSRLLDQENVGFNEARVYRDDRHIVTTVEIPIQADEGAFALYREWPSSFIDNNEEIVEANQHNFFTNLSLVKMYHVHNSECYLHASCREIHLKDSNYWWTDKSNNKRDACKKKYDNLTVGLYHKEEQSFGVDLCVDETGPLAELFDRLVDWHTVAESYMCSDETFEEWIEKLEQATKRGYIRWRSYGRWFETYYGKTFIEIELADTNLEKSKGEYSYSRRGDIMYIKESENNLYYYGEKKLCFTNDAQETEKPIVIPNMSLRKLTELICECEKRIENGEYAKTQFKKRIKQTDVLAITYSFFCAFRKHHVLPCCGTVRLLTPQYEIIEEEVYLNYCKTCEKYFIFKRDYDLLTAKGVLLCKVVKANTGKVVSDCTFSLNDQSVINALGYNVNAAEDLSATDRKRILKEIIETGIVSVNEIANLIEMQIRLHTNDRKYDNAIQKWKDDVEFVKTYGTSAGQKKQITKINI